jgi:hypothetical protein
VERSHDPVEDIEPIDSEILDDEARGIADMRAEAADECNFIVLANLFAAQQPTKRPQDTLVQPRYGRT